MFRKNTEYTGVAPRIALCTIRDNARTPSSETVCAIPAYANFPFSLDQLFVVGGVDLDASVIAQAEARRISVVFFTAVS